MREKKKCENCYEKVYELFKVKIEENGDFINLCGDCKEQLIKSNT